MLNIEKEKQIAEIEKKINSLLPDILIPLRTSKSIASDSINELYFHLEELKNIMHGEKYILRSLTGRLFSIYKMIDGEARHARGAEQIPVLRELSKLATFIEEIYWDN